MEHQYLIMLLSNVHVLPACFQLYCYTLILPYSLSDQIHALLVTIPIQMTHCKNVLPAFHCEIPTARDYTR